MARIRSPNYPQLSLPAAIARVAPVFAKERKHPAPKEVIIKHLGYSSVNGASLGSLSALLKYGLLDRDGENFVVSDRAVSILHPASPEEKTHALRDAANAPALFAEILENFKGEIPSDENLRAYLIRKGFAENAGESVIGTLRETMELIQSEPMNRTGSGALTAGPSSMQGKAHVYSTAYGALTTAPTPLVPTEEPKYERLRVTLTTNGIEVMGKISTRSEMNYLIGVLNQISPILPATDAKLEGEGEFIGESVSDHHDPL